MIMTEYSLRVREALLLIFLNRSRRIRVTQVAPVQAQPFPRTSHLDAAQCRCKCLPTAL